MVLGFSAPQGQMNIPRRFNEEKETEKTEQPWSPRRTRLGHHEVVRGAEELFRRGTETTRQIRTANNVLPFLSGTGVLPLGAKIETGTMRGATTRCDCFPGTAFGCNVHLFEPFDRSRMDKIH